MLEGGHGANGKTRRKWAVSHRISGAHSHVKHPKKTYKQENGNPEENKDFIQLITRKHFTIIPRFRTI